MSLSRHTTYNLIGALVPLMLSLVTVPAYLHLVGVERYGVLQIAWLLLGYFGLFDLGLGRATSFRIAAQHNASADARAETFWSALVVNIAMGFMGGAVLWFCAQYAFVDHARVSALIRSEMLAAIPFLAVSVPIATATGVLTGALQGREKFLETNSISVTSTVMFQLLPLGIALFWLPYLPALLAAALSARLVGLSILMRRCWLELVVGAPIRISSEAMTSLLRYGGWVTLTAIFGPMLVMADRFAMGAMLGMVAVAVYSIPYNLASRIAVMPAALTNALFPKLSSAAPAEARAMGDAATTLMLALISPPVLIAILAAEPFLKLWVGAQMGASAAPVARILILAFWFNALALVSFTRLQARGRPDIVTKVLLLQIPPYWLALYFGMTRFGLLGCALACLLRMVMDFGLQSWMSDGAKMRIAPVARYGALLLVTVIIASMISYHHAVFLLACAVLAVLILILSWRDMPLAMRARFIAYMPLTPRLRWLS